MTDTALALPTAAGGRRSWWPTFFLCLVGIVLPNMLSLGALVAGIGVPPRSTPIICYALLAILARLLAAPIVIALFVAVAIYDAVSTIALLFNLAPSEIVLALNIAGNLDLFRSPLYIGLGAASLLFVGINVWLLTRKRALLQRGNIVVMAGLALAFAAADFLTNTSPHYQFGTLYGVGKPMASASTSSGFGQAALGGTNRPVLLVIVEALGEFADPAHRAYLSAPLRDPALAKRYSLTSGSTTYFGSTTAAEMRELCFSREPYRALLDGLKVQCLPEMMAAKGYDTVALHNFTSRFFERDQWYPLIGFKRRIFREDLAGVPMRLCGGPFRGPCDTDMIPVIAKTFREATKPTFFYWMTLSTHVPIAPREGTPRLSCERNGGKIGQTEVCFMTEMWIDVLEAVARMTADLPPMEILIVGDHAPPLWSKAGRHLFVPGKVPWFRLTPKEATASSGASRLANLARALP